jgi:hypothetical protein
MQPLPSDLAAIETALDTGRIQAEMTNGRWWQVRRNGATKTWKTRPGEFRIPIKAGLRSCAYLTEANSRHFRMEESQ